jgi:hypothetical protein
LFTLVGIAGEDDLDAPDLPVNTTDGGAVDPGHPEKMNGHAAAAVMSSVPTFGNGTRRKPPTPKPVLDAEASAAARDRLVQEIAAVDAAEAAIEWAGRSLGAKNTLTAEDARAVEEAFRDRMQVLEPETSSPNTVPPELPNAPAEAAPQPGSASPADPAASAEVPGPVREPRDQRKPQGSRISIEGVDGVALVQPRRCRDKHHLRFITVQPCIVCGRQPCEAHHLRFAQPRALGRKVSDEFTVPLCRVHHRELHRLGDEAAWWKRVNIDPLSIALGFWQHTRGILPAAGGSRAPQPPTTDTSVEERSKAGGGSYGSLPLPPSIADGSTTR